MDMVDKQKVAAFKAKAQVFGQEFARLESRRDKIPAIWRGDFERMMGRGADVKQRIQAAADSIDTSYRFARDTLKIPEQNINGLGIIPLIPLAFIAGSTAVTTYFVTDAQKFNAKIDELERLQEMGYTADEAAAIVEKGAISVPAPIASVWNNRPLRYAGFALLGWYGYNKFIKPRMKGAIK